MPKANFLPGFSFVKEVRTELDKISWPTRRQVVRMSTLVIGVSAAVSAYIGALDYLFVRLVAILINN